LCLQESEKRAKFGKKQANAKTVSASAQDAAHPQINHHGLVVAENDDVEFFTRMLQQGFVLLNVIGEIAVDGKDHITRTKPRFFSR
jgi:hypothetical protein